MRFDLNGEEQLSKSLEKLSQIEYEAIVKLNMTEIYNRGKKRPPTPGGTPFRTGELRQSLGLTKSIRNAYDVGYTKEYAPHVEYGHRTANGGWVEGQFFLKQNVQKQAPLMRKDILQRLKKAGG